jgi:hypothetical protein
VDGDVLGQPKAHRGLSDVCRFPHAVLQLCRSTSTSWRAQEPARGRLARGVDFGGRGEVTGDVVTSGVELVDEGGKKTVWLSLASGS